MPAEKRLTDRQIKNSPPGKLYDGGGLICVKGANSAKWVYRYTLYSARRDMGLGTYPQISLAQARELLAEYRTLVAQKIDPISGGYSDELFRAVFGGFLPSRNPRVVIAVVVDEPIGKHTGGAVAGPVFSEIGSAAMLHLKVLPTLEQEARPTSNVAAAIARINQLPSISTNPEAAEENLDEPSSGTIPSFLGLSARQSLVRYQELGIDSNIELVGSGAVVKQEPRAGTRFGDVDKLRLVLGQR